MNTDMKIIDKVIWFFLALFIGIAYGMKEISGTTGILLLIVAGVFLSQVLLVFALYIQFLEFRRKKLKSITETDKSNR
ncbi:DUF2892 domain-containing protein [Flavobacterium luteum]|uniref:DUF2892 domain-containing protein n=1 Tax=Flavobacterium luteum TaxID=2026654 RepID=UPI001CD9FFC7|nr:DUF2892 domain-containing protein [Flavobacterium luteum]